ESKKAPTQTAKTPQKSLRCERRGEARNAPRHHDNSCAGSSTEVGGKKTRRPQAGRICSRASLRRRVEGRKGSRESAVRNDLAAVLERVRQAQEGGWNVSQYVVVKSRTWLGHREVAFLFVRSCRLGQCVHSSRDTKCPLLG